MPQNIGNSYQTYFSPPFYVWPAGLGCNEDCVCVATTARMHVPFVTLPTTRVELQIESNKQRHSMEVLDLAVSKKVARPGLASPWCSDATTYTISYLVKDASVVSSMHNEKKGEAQRCS